MLSEPVLKTFSRFLLFNTKLYLIPSIWDPVKRQFVKQTGIHKRVETILFLIEICFRIWINGAYGYMLYKSLQETSTVIRACLPLMYLCSMTWCGIIRFSSRAYKAQIEQFINNFMKLNDYLSK